MRWQAGRYGHARQYRRMGRAVVARQRTIAGRLLRDCERRVANAEMSAQQFERLRNPFGRMRRILTQGKKTKGKLYAPHATEAECISKGKVAQRNEIGVKVGCGHPSPRSHAGRALLPRQSLRMTHACRTTGALKFRS